MDANFLWIDLLPPKQIEEWVLIEELISPFYNIETFTQATAIV